MTTNKFTANLLSDAEFGFEIETGKTIVCRALARHVYTNGLFAIGIAKGLEPDNYFLAMIQDDNGELRFFREDELASVGILILQALVTKKEGKACILALSDIVSTGEAQYEATK